MKVRVSTASGSTGWRAVTEHLDRLGLSYEVMPHARTESATREASATGVTAAETMKTLVLRDAGHRLRLVALPASERLDLRKVRTLLGDPRLELASEQDLAGHLPLYDIGAVPPLGPGVPQLAVLDQRVRARPRVVCSAGDHRHALAVVPAELEAAASPRVADICQD